MIDGHRNSLLQQHATQDIRLKGLFVQKPSSANQVRQAIAQAHPLTTQVGQVRLFASALNPYLNYINTVYECLYLNTFVHIFSNHCQPQRRLRSMKSRTFCCCSGRRLSKKSAAAAITSGLPACTAAVFSS